MFCVGLNYRTHILEMGRELPEYPTLFAKFAEALIGAYDPIELPAGSREVDWEAELGVVIGTRSGAPTPTEAEAAIAGYTVVNDVTVRDFQYRIGAVVAGQDVRAQHAGRAVAGASTKAARRRAPREVDGDVVQKAATADLVFDPVRPGRLHLPDDHLAARRHHRHRHPRWRRACPQTPALPRTRATLATRIDGYRRAGQRRGGGKGERRAGTSRGRRMTSPPRTRRARPCGNGRGPEPATTRPTRPPANCSGPGGARPTSPASSANCPTPSSTNPACCRAGPGGTCSPTSATTPGR